MCNCIDQIDANLNELGHNTQLDIAINVTNPNMPSVMMKIATMKRDDRRHTKPVNLIATYCPICGEKYGAQS